MPLHAEATWGYRTKHRRDKTQDTFDIPDKINQPHLHNKRGDDCCVCINKIDGNKKQYKKTMILTRPARPLTTQHVHQGKKRKKKEKKNISTRHVHVSPVTAKGPPRTAPLLQGKPATPHQPLQTISWMRWKTKLASKKSASKTLGLFTRKHEPCCSTVVCQQLVPTACADSYCADSVVPTAIVPTAKGKHRPLADSSRLPPHPPTFTKPQKLLQR